jgi:hypothetical protein
MKETDIPQLLAIKQANEEEISQLKDAWTKEAIARAVYTPGPATAASSKCMFLEPTTEQPTISSPAHDADMDTETRKGDTKKKEYIPKHNHPAETAKREAEVGKLRATQEQRESISHGSDEIMERVRKWKIADELYKNERWEFGVELYNRKGWKQYRGQGIWDIWDGCGWYARERG